MQQQLLASLAARQQVEQDRNRHAAFAEPSGETQTGRGITEAATR